MRQRLPSRLHCQRCKGGVIQPGGESPVSLVTQVIFAAAALYWWIHGVLEVRAVMRTSRLQHRPPVELLPHCRHIWADFEEDMEPRFRGG
jgi:hypothetical protein